MRKKHPIRNVKELHDLTVALLYLPYKHLLTKQHHSNKKINMIKQFWYSYKQEYYTFDFTMNKCMFVFHHALTVFLLKNITYFNLIDLKNLNTSSFVHIDYMHTMFYL